MKLLELFSSKVPHETLHGEGEVVWTATVNGRKIVVTADRMYKAARLWEVSFAEERPDGYHWNLTGNGGAVQVFSLMKEFIEHLIDKKDQTGKSVVRTIRFTAEEPNRIKLYTAMVKKLGYPHTIDHEDGFTVFRIEVDS